MRCCNRQRLSRSEVSIVAIVCIWCSQHCQHSLCTHRCGSSWARWAHSTCWWMYLESARYYHNQQVIYVHLWSNIVCSLFKSLINSVFTEEDVTIARLRLLCCMKSIAVRVNSTTSKNAIDRVNSFLQQHHSNDRLPQETCPLCEGVVHFSAEHPLYSECAQCSIGVDRCCSTLQLVTAIDSSLSKCSLCSAMHSDVIGLCRQCRVQLVKLWCHESWQQDFSIDFLYIYLQERLSVTNLNNESWRSIC